MPISDISRFAGIMGIYQCEGTLENKNKRAGIPSSYHIGVRVLSCSYPWVMDVREMK